MAVSTISQFTNEGFVLGTSGFVRSGVIYVLWSTAIGGGRKIQWRPHTELNPVEISGQMQAAFNNLSCITLQDNNLLVVWDDDSGLSSNGSVFQAVFNPLTGAVISGPTTLAKGAKPSLMYLGGTFGPNLVLSFIHRVRKAFYLMKSRNSAASWDAPVPVLNNRALDSDDAVAVPFSDTHVSVAQLGRSGRDLLEVSAFTRTRPLVSIVKHPTLANRFFVGEPSRFSGTFLNDNLRGGLKLSTDQSKIFHLDGTAVGTADSINPVALVNFTGAPAVVASAGPLGNGDNFVHYTLTPVVGTNIELAGGTEAVSFDVSATQAYIASKSDTGVTGELNVVNLFTDIPTVFLTGISAGDAVAVGNFPAAVPVIFYATLETAVPRLRVYTENGATPNLRTIHKLPARANSITVVMSSGIAGTLYVSMTDRLNVYSFNGLESPLRLLLSIPMMTYGQFFTAKVATNGNIVAAMGNGGVGVFNQFGKCLGQTLVSGLSIPEWKGNTVYGALATVRPKATNSFAGQRYYFRTTSGGTSTTYEPAWAKTGTMTDGSVIWTPVSEVDGWAVDIALDESTKKIYAAGIAGGATGTDGRVWVLNATTLLGPL